MLGVQIPCSAITHSGDGYRTYGTTVDYTVNIIERNGEYFLQEVFAVTEFQYGEQVTAGPFTTRWKADVQRSVDYPAYRGLTDEYCRLQH